jgi:hypothetical protein
MWRRKRSAGDPDAARSGLPEGQHGEDTSFTQSYTAADFARDQEEAQRNALAEAGISAESRDAPGQPAEEQLGWCSANGLFAGLSGGALGAVYGLGESQRLISEGGVFLIRRSATSRQEGCQMAGAAHVWEKVHSENLLIGNVLSSSCRLQADHAQRPWPFEGSPRQRSLKCKGAGSMRSLATA